jgi:anti-repressor protein
MNELIKIEDRPIGNDQVQTINARELHAFLEVKSEFRHWIKNRIDDFGFAEEQDFVTSVKNYRGGESKDYHVTLDMAKELAMVERNEKGKQARQYFIECERRVKASILSLPDFTDPAASARAWAEQYEAKQAALIQLEAAKPAVEFVGKYVDATGTFGFRQVCKLLEANENEFREFIFSKGIVYRLNGVLTPKTEHIRAGRFDVKTGMNDKNNHSFTQMRFTAKGVQWIAGMWIAEQQINSVAIAEIEETVNE